MNERDAYRFDVRTRDQFKREIAEGNRQEGILFHRWLKTQPGATYRETGCGMGGEYLEANRVSLAPDFEVNGVSVEVKFCRNVPPFFHLKLSQVEHYFSIPNAHILMVLGSDTENPKFSLVTPDDLGYLMDECERVFCRQFGNKESLRVPSDWLIWKPLP